MTDLIADGRIKLTHEGDYSLLYCPRCGSRNLHHLGVTVFDRGEDNGQVIKTSVLPGKTATEVVQSSGSGNPSTRRDGLAIQFACEGCSWNTSDTIELTVAQHKGDTEVAWRFHPRAKLEQK